MEGYGQNKKFSLDDGKSIPVIRALRERGFYAPSLGAFPPIWRPLIKRLPIVNLSSEHAEALTGVAVAAVSRRLADPTPHLDFLTKLLEAKDETGKPIGPEELTGEALTLLIGGTGTTLKFVIPDTPL